MKNISTKMIVSIVIGVAACTAVIFFLKSQSRMHGNAEIFMGEKTSGAEVPENIQGVQASPSQMPSVPGSYIPYKIIDTTHSAFQLSEKSVTQVGAVKVSVGHIQSVGNAIVPLVTPANKMAPKVQPIPIHSSYAPTVQKPAVQVISIGKKVNS